jgi:hypothetical protein
MSTAVPNETTTPDATATPAPAANATPAPTTTATPAPAAADPNTTGTAPAPNPATPAEAEDEGDDSILDLDDDAGEPAKPEGDKPAEGEAAEPDKAPASNAWAKERDAAADAYLAKLDKKLSVDKDGKPLSARQKQAAVDDAREKFLSKLARYPSLTAALIAGINAQDKISTGKYKAPLADDATDEEIAAWRKDNGIPEDAKGYKLPKVQGEEWTDADRPGLDKLLSRMHEKNASQAQVDAVLATYKEVVAEAREAQREQLSAIDKADTQATRDALRDEFEGEFKPAMTLLKRLVNDGEVFPDEAGKLIADARTADGHRLINNPAIARFLINFAREHYGEGSMLSGDQQAAANTEEQELLNLMKTDIDAYNFKPWKTTGMTASQRLLEIRRQKEARGGRRAA